MKRFNVAMGILVGVLLGIANGLGFQSIPVGILTGICFSALFIFLFSKFPKKKDKSS